ncbi:MAG: HAMP domain-containing protein [Rhodobacter sp.]|nr:HAMP domain-containing protein [Rhodobacter sp.]
MLNRVQHWPWLTLQIIAANVVIILALAAVWSWAFMQQSSAYSERLMSTFDIEPGTLHAMYVEDVERQLWASAFLGLFIAVLASFGLAFLIVRPLRSLAKATERLRHGDYRVRSTIGTGEVGRLAETFNALAAELEQEDRRRTQYMADLSHELRTPITSLRGYTEGLEDGVFQADERFFRLMEDELSHLTALTNTIESMQLDAGSRDEQHGSHAGIADFFESTISSWKTRFLQRGLQLDLSISENVKNEQSVISPNAMKQIVDNLLSNMLRYASAEEPCEIRLSRGKRANSVEVAFGNDAPDVDDSSLPFLFDRFYRVSKSRTRVDREHPSGLGLSIVKQICISNNGNVSATLDGRRLVIAVELPLVTPDP